MEVKPSEVFEQTVVAPATAVAGTVQACAFLLVEWIGNKTICGQFRVVQVTQRDTVAADADFARDADGAGLKLLVEDPHTRVRYRSADRHAALRCSSSAHMPHGRPNRGFGWAVHVPEFTGALDEVVRKIRWQALAADQRLEASAAIPCRIQQHSPHARRGLHHRRATAFEQSEEQVAVHGRFARHDHYLCADAERKHQLQHRNVK